MLTQARLSYLYQMGIIMTEICGRIRGSRLDAKLNQTELAKRVGVSKVAVSQWENGDTQPKGENLLKLASALGVSPQWLVNGKGDPSAGLPELESAPIGGRMVPIISEVQAGTWKEIRDNLQTAEMLLTDLSLGAHAFALTIRGDSMLPDFREGDRVIIDPDVRPSPGDFVVAINGGNAATFKKYRERGIGADGDTVFELVPLNADYPTLRSDIEKIDIIGTMMEHRKYRRR